MAKKYVTMDFKSYDIPSKLPEFLAWLESQIEATGVPRNQINVSLSAYDDYGSPSATFDLEFEREETEAEKEARLAQAARSEEWDRKTYERLKAKFGDK